MILDLGDVAPLPPPFLDEGMARAWPHPLGDRNRVLQSSFFKKSESDYDHDHPFLHQKVSRLMAMTMPSTPFSRRGEM